MKQDLQKLTNSKHRLGIIWMSQNTQILQSCQLSENIQSNTQDLIGAGEKKSKYTQRRDYCYSTVDGANTS